MNEADITRVRRRIQAALETLGRAEAHLARPRPRRGSHSRARAALLRAEEHLEVALGALAVGAYCQGSGASSSPPSTR